MEAATKDAFDAHLELMATPVTWGGDPELQALSEIYNRPLQIWAYDASDGAKLLREFASDGPLPSFAAQAVPAASVAATPPIRLSFFMGGHYDSAHPVDLGSAPSSLLQSAPGVHEKGVLDGCDLGGHDDGVAFVDSSRDKLLLVALSRNLPVDFALAEEIVEIVEARMKKYRSRIRTTTQRPMNYLRLLRRWMRDLRSSMTSTYSLENAATNLVLLLLPNRLLLILPKHQFLQKRNSLQPSALVVVRHQRRHRNGRAVPSVDPHMNGRRRNSLW